jgi:hypothetical protein
MPINFTPLLEIIPTVIFFSIVLLDIYKSFGAKYSNPQVSIKKIILPSFFFLWYALFIHFGIRTISQLLARSTGTFYAHWFTAFTLTIGFYFTKLIFNSIHQKSSLHATGLSYKIFLHYFGYSSGALIFLLIITFATATILHHLF